MAGLCPEALRSDACGHAKGRADRGHQSLIRDLVNGGHETARFLELIRSAPESCNLENHSTARWTCKTATLGHERDA